MSTISYIEKDLDEIIAILNSPINSIINIISLVLSFFAVVIAIYVYVMQKNILNKNRLNELKKMLLSIIRICKRGHKDNVSELKVVFDTYNIRDDVIELSEKLKAYDEKLAKEILRIIEIDEDTNFFEYEEWAKDMLNKLEKYRGV